MKIKSPKDPSCSASENGSFIDFAILSDNITVTNCDINDKLPSKEIFSDHSVIFIEITCDKIKLIEPIKIKNFKKTKWNKLNSFIDGKISDLKIPLYNNMSACQINNICLEIENIFKNAISLHVPEIKIQPQQVELSTKSLNLIREKKQLMRRKHRNRNNQNLNVIKSQLNILNQLLIKSISDDYKNCWKTKLKQIKPDNNLFKNIKAISAYKSKNNMPSTVFNSDKSEAYVTDKEKCNAFSEQFAKAHELTLNDESPIDNEVQQINSLYDNANAIVTFSATLPADFKEYPEQCTVNPFGRNFISSTELHNIIKSRNNKKSSGNDNMPNFILKKLSFTTIYWLAVLFNHITNIQHIPSNWKHALVTPVPKPNKNSEIISNWRPISQLPTISKCYEKVLDNMIRATCIENNLIDPFQFGFQPGCGTVHAIAKIFNDIANGLNHRRPTLAVLIDLQSAFDVIWHEGLILKRHQLNFQPFIIRLVKNFLENRLFHVKVNNIISNVKHIKAGTPQGSIISAICFILFLNDLPKPSNFFCTIFRVIFADDIVIYTITKNIQLAFDNCINEQLFKSS